MPTNSEIAKQACDLLESVKEVAAAGICSPRLLTEIVGRLPPYQVKQIASFSQQLVKLLDGRPGLHAAYRVALVGTHVPPHDDPRTDDAVPPPPVPGLVMGDRARLDELLAAHPHVAAFVVAMLGAPCSPAYEALCSANMLWLQKHPCDLVAATNEQRVLAISSAQLKRKDLGAKLRHLLMLNLQLKCPAERWVPVLAVRDRVANVLAAAHASLEELVTRCPLDRTDSGRFESPRAAPSPVGAGREPASLLGAITTKSTAASQAAVAHAKGGVNGPTSPTRAPSLTGRVEAVLRTLERASSSLALPRIQSSLKEVFDSLNEHIAACVGDVAPALHAVQEATSPRSSSPLRLFQSESTEERTRKEVGVALSSLLADLRSEMTQLAAAGAAASLSLTVTNGESSSSGGAA